MRTAKEIRNYLRQQKWYKEYVYNAKKHAKIWNSIYPKNEKNFIRGYKKEMTICSAFFWVESFPSSTKWYLRDRNFINWYNRKRNENRK